MIPVSAGFKRAATTSHEAKFKVQLREIDGTLVEDLTDSLIGGEVTIDSTASFRRQLSLTLSQEAVGWSGGTYGDIAATYAAGTGARTYGQLAGASRGKITPQAGYEIHVWRGIVVSGATEWAKLGVFHIASVSSSASHSSTIEIVGYDRSRLVSLNKLIVTSEATGGIEAHLMFGVLTEMLLPAYQFERKGADISQVQERGAYIYEQGDDPWDAMRRAAAIYGLEMYFDHDGDLVIDQIKRPTKTAVWTFRSGSNGTLIERQFDQDDEGVCNSVAVISNEGILAAVSDSDTNSWTYARGAFGVRTHIENVDQQLTKEQATALALNLLMEKQRLIQELTVQSVPMPAIEPGDTVRLYDSSGVNGLYFVIAVTIPLDLTTPMTTIVRKI